MLLLLDIGNTHTHIGTRARSRVVDRGEIPTSAWKGRDVWTQLVRKIGTDRFTGVVLCSVVPAATDRAVDVLRRRTGTEPLVLASDTLRGVGVDYPAPETIGPDRLANAIAARHFYGSPVLVVDFGTAVTFDVVNAVGDYVGGVIAPGLNAMTDYLHEKTALLPRITIRDVRSAIGKSTTDAMLVGAVHGYRGLIRGLVSEIRTELKARRLPVIATGGCAELIARGMREITQVRPLLTLEGLQLFHELHGR